MNFCYVFAWIVFGGIFAKQYSNQVDSGLNLVQNLVLVVIHRFSYGIGGALEHKLILFYKISKQLGH